MSTRPTRTAASSAILLTLLFGSIVTAALLAEAAQKKTTADSVLAADKGKFNILVDGKSLGHEEFDIAPGSYEWTSHTDKTNGAHVDFSNGVAKMTLQMEGARPFEQELSFNSPRVLVLDNNLYHQYIILCHLYDWTHRGEQTFSVLIPQQLTPGTIKVDSAGTVTDDGKSYEG